MIGNELILPRIALLATLLLALVPPASATTPLSPAEQLADAALAEQPESLRRAAEAAMADTLSLPWLELAFRGGWLMVPIVLMSIVVVAIGIERLIALRRGRLLPSALVSWLNQAAQRGTFDARSTLAMCEQFPSTLGRVVETMIRKTGRPPGEVEQAVTDACQREADRMYANVRTLHLATSVTPLLGLMGTVLGMIHAFFATANMPLGSNKGQALAEGIYVALVTTFAGLAVAIPAAVLAHLFEARILRRLRDVDLIARRLLPQVDESATQLRVDPRHGGASEPVTVAKLQPKSKAS